jgi:hypothetical protein
MRSGVVDLDSNGRGRRHVVVVVVVIVVVVVVGEMVSGEKL